MLLKYLRLETSFYPKFLSQAISWFFIFILFIFNKRQFGVEGNAVATISNFIFTDN